MGFFDIWIGKSESLDSSGVGMMEGAINKDLPQLSGEGAMLSPADNNYKGHFKDGDLVLRAEESKLENYELLAGDAKEYRTKADADYRFAKDFYKNIAKGSDKRAKIVAMHTRTKNIVTANHLRQFQSNSALKKGQMKIAGGYLLEKDRMTEAADKTTQKLEKFRQKLTASNSQRM